MPRPLIDLEELRRRMRSGCTGPAPKPSAAPRDPARAERQRRLSKAETIAWAHRRVAEAEAKIELAEYQSRVRRAKRARAEAMAILTSTKEGRIALARARARALLAE